MITDNDLKIANTSYINKDFASIYPELLDLVKSLTSKWDPQTSNESDPGIVLLKAMAFMGDKLSYNTDKNVLEAYMPSATQASSMRKLCDMMGYNIGYYSSAEVNVTFLYTGSALDDVTAGSFIFPALSTTLSSSEDESICFVLQEDVEISKKNQAVTKVAIQGTLKTLESSSSDLIQLTDLDDNRRIYFPVANVAQNGVFISDGSTATPSWKKKDNLNTQLPNTEVYKFGYDSDRGVPYIEFPEDIASLIGSGLKIQYLVTLGADGNIKAKFLDKLVSPVSDIAILSSGADTGNTISFTDSTDITIKNSSSSILGSDPETVNEAYNSYKKTIGTFDTLVTCRDYANFIYNMYDVNDEFPVVSNCQVSDRRDDINYATRVVTFDEYGQKTASFSSSDITAYNLCLYPLNPILTYTVANYLSSFQPLTNTSDITKEIETSKTASHDYKTLSATDIYLLKNYVALDAKLSTTYKVNDYEQAEIITNVQDALIEKFNARDVDYGYEIPYDTLLSCIKDSDSRISSVSLAEPELTTYVMTKSGAENKLINASTTSQGQFLKVVSRNLLEGKIALFDTDSRFNYDFGQKANTGSSKMVVDNLASVDTEANITLSANTKYTLGANEVIQLISPSLVTNTQYTTYINFSFYSKNGNTVTDGTNYELKANEALLINYTDSDDNEVNLLFEQGQIIQPVGFNLYTTVAHTASTDRSTINKTLDQVTIEKILAGSYSFAMDGSQYLFYTLGTTEEIDTKTLNIVKFGDSSRPCYWIRNNSTNSLFLASDYADSKYKVTLGDGEYFFYTDSAFSDYAVVGSGTTIECNYPLQTDSATYWHADTIDIDEVSSGGLLALTSKWRTLAFTADSVSNGTYLKLTENTILTLTEGDVATTSVEQLLTNDFATLKGNFSYKLGTDSEVALDKNVISSSSTEDDYSWKIRSRLDLDSGKLTPQTLVNKQTMVFKDSSNATYSMVAGDIVALNDTLQFAGGSNVSLSSVDITTNETIYPVSAYIYDLDVVDGATRTIDRVNGYGTLTFDAMSLSKTYLMPTITGRKLVLMLYWTGSTDALTLSMSATGTGTVTWKDYNGTNTETSTALALTKGIHCIEFSSNASAIDLTLASGTGTLILGSLDYTNGLNSQLGLTTFATATGVTESTLETALFALLDGKGFYYNCKIDNSKVIETDDLTSPYALYDSNNVANKFTISEIALDSSSSISVVRSSRL